MNDYFDFNQDNSILTDDDIKMNEFFKEYTQILNKRIKNYPELFFSKKKLMKYVNIERIIAKGEYGKVNIFFFTQNDKI